MFEDHEELLTINEMRELLGVGKNTAYTLLKDGAIKSLRIGKLWRIPKKAVEEYILTQSGLTNS